MKKLAVMAAAVLSAPVCALLEAVGIRRRPAPWRRTVGLGLRSEGAKFALSAFGLMAPVPFGTDDWELRLAESLRSLLGSEPWGKYRLRHRRFVVERVPSPSFDFVIGRFAGDGTLESLMPALDPQLPDAVPEGRTREILRRLAALYNLARIHPESCRARIMHESLPGMLGLYADHRERTRELAYARRLLNANMLFFDDQETDSRFSPPPFAERRVLGGGGLNLAVRLAPDGRIDLWAQAHHTFIDGAPLQEALSRIENEWQGDRHTIEFPPRSQPATPPPAAAPCFAVKAERRVHCITEFFDFTGLRQSRERFPKPGRPALAPMLIWRLASQEEFSGARFCCAVDVPALGAHERAVDLVSIRPADFGRPGQFGSPEFALFSAAFARLLEAAKTRRTATWGAMRKASLVPSCLASPLLHCSPENAHRTFGEVGISILRDAAVFIAPMADAAFEGGFLAIGNIDLPSRHGSSTGCISMKGEIERITRYPEAIRRALAVDG